MIRANIKGVYVGRLISGDDLVLSLEKLAREEGIQGGVVQVIGALSKVRVGYYDISRKEYDEVVEEGAFELVSGIGTISLKDGQPLVHIHISTSSRDGRVVMGHALPGNIVSVTAEYVILALDAKVERVFDLNTGLYLLRM